MPFMGIDEYFPEQKDEAPTGGGGLFDDERFRPADTGQRDPTVYTDEDVKQIQEGLTDVPAPGDITIKKLVNKDNPDDFIMRFCCNLNIEDKYIELCSYIIDKADEYSIVSENAPPSIAVGTIYLVSNLCKLNITKKEISKECDISEVTINKCYNKLEKYKKY